MQQQPRVPSVQAEVGQGARPPQRLEGEVVVAGGDGRREAVGEAAPGCEVARRAQQQQPVPRRHRAAEPPDPSRGRRPLGGEGVAQPTEEVAVVEQVVGPDGTLYSAIDVKTQPSPARRCVDRYFAW
eukprot:COSAG04_NODE_953_length_9207_cov_15.426987_2_plen_127_part_00